MFSKKVSVLDKQKYYYLLNNAYLCHRIGLSIFNDNSIKPKQEIYEPKQFFLTILSCLPCFLGGLRGK